MIAELEQKPFSFSTFDRKISYHLGKIANGVGELIHVSIGKSDLDSFNTIASRIANRNKNVSLQFNEVSLNLNKGMKMDNDKFLEIAQDYMQRLGYDDSAYAVVRHTDKDHEHLHILFTTTDTFGVRISDSGIRRRSMAISRALEKDYGLEETVYNKFNSKSLGEVKAREYFYHNAIQKSLKSFKSQSTMMEMLGRDLLNEIQTMKTPLDNTKFEILLGKALYDRVGGYLDKNGYFKPLFKDELLSKLDRAYSLSRSYNDFKNKLEQEEVYVRFVTDKGVSRYVYGIPGASFYTKDSTLPQKYRYGTLEFLNFKTNITQKQFIHTPNGENIIEESIPLSNNNLASDEQKHIIYNQAFLALNTSSNYADFKAKLKEGNIKVIESINTKGISGLAFEITNIGNSIQFRASDISRRLTYSNINKYFDEKLNPSIRDANNPIESITNNPKIVHEMHERMEQNYPEYVDTNYRSEQEDNVDLSAQRKKKNRNKRSR